MMCELYNPYHFTAIQTSSTFNVAIVTNHREKLNKSLAEKRGKRWKWFSNIILITHLLAITLNKWIWIQSMNFFYSTGASVVHKVHLMRNLPDEKQKQFDSLSSLMCPKNNGRFCYYDYERLQMLTLLSSWRITQPNLLLHKCNTPCIYFYFIFHLVACILLWGAQSKSFFHIKSTHF